MTRPSSNFLVLQVVMGAAGFIVSRLRPALAALHLSDGLLSTGHPMASATQARPPSSSISLGAAVADRADWLQINVG